LKEKLDSQKIEALNKKVKQEEAAKEPKLLKQKRKR
jgi:small subunit ribosomal protein S1